VGREGKSPLSDASGRFRAVRGDRDMKLKRLLSGLTKHAEGIIAVNRNAA
jgi:hypothetical protein